MLFANWDFSNVQRCSIRTFAIDFCDQRRVLMSLPIEFGKENTEFETIGPQQKSGFSESQKSGFWTKIALTEEQIASEISSLRQRTQNPFKFGWLQHKNQAKKNYMSQTSNLTKVQPSKVQNVEIWCPIQFVSIQIRAHQNLFIGLRYNFFFCMVFIIKLTGFK